MWAGLGGLITLAVMLLKLWAEHDTQKEDKFNADKKAISDAVASGDNARIHAIINLMRR